MAKKVKDKPKQVAAFKPKMRVSLLDENLVKVSDRLVSMDTELVNGPIEKHKGPITLEFTLRDQSAVSALGIYLDKLIGDLPLPEKKVYKASKKVSTLLDEEPLKEFIKDIKIKIKNIDSLITYLRDKGFVFVTGQFLEDFGIPFNKHKADTEKQFMVRRLKEAKDPKNDKYDPQLIFSLRFMGIKKGGVRIYLYGEQHERLELEWLEKSDFNFKKVKLTKFPPYMIKEEREKYRFEERKYKANPELERSKFWNRWHDVVVSFNK